MGCFVTAAQHVEETINSDVTTDLAVSSWLCGHVVVYGAVFMRLSLVEFSLWLQTET